MAMQSRSRARSRVGPLIAVGVLMLSVVLRRQATLYVGWQPFTHKPGFSLSAHRLFRHGGWTARSPCPRHWPHAPDSTRQA